MAQTLLRVADGFHACGVPARVKTASEKARASFAKMTSLLRFVGFKDPTTAGVSKSRGVRTVVVVDDVGKGSEEKEKGKTDVDRADRADRAAAVPPRWGSDPGDARAHARRGWGKTTLSDSANRTRLRRPTSSTSPSARRGGMNRVAPDTVDACAARVSRALFCTTKKWTKPSTRRRRRRGRRLRAARGARADVRVDARRCCAPALAPLREKATEATLQTHVVSRSRRSESPFRERRYRRGGRGGVRRRAHRAKTTGSA